MWLVEISKLLGRKKLHKTQMFYSFFENRNDEFLLILTYSDSVVSSDESIVKSTSAMLVFLAFTYNSLKLILD